MKHTVTNRLIIGKSLGFLIGAIAFFMMPVFGLDLDIKFRLGVWLIYTLIGVLTAFFGIMDRHPILNFRMSPWFRGMVAGLSIHLVLVLVAYDQLASILSTLNFMGMLSPWWVLVDGMVVGIILSIVETYFAGEGDLPLK